MEAATLPSISLMLLAYNGSRLTTQSSGRDVDFWVYFKKVVFSRRAWKLQLVSTISIAQNENNIFRFEDYLSVQHGGEGGQGECSSLAFTSMFIASNLLP